jgi:transcriptional regulator with XRE-family HTH domain
MKSKPRKTPRIEALSLQVGSKVVKLRLDREWTQVDLASASSLGQGFISRIESGSVEPCLGVLDSLATAFKLSLSELLKGIE